MENGQQLQYAAIEVSRRMNRAGSAIGNMLAIPKKQPYQEVLRMQKEYLLYLKLKRKYG